MAIQGQDINSSLIYSYHSVEQIIKTQTCIAFGRTGRKTTLDRLHDSFVIIK